MLKKQALKSMEDLSSISVIHTADAAVGLFLNGLFLLHGLGSRGQFVVIICETKNIFFWYSFL